MFFFGLCLFALVSIPRLLSLNAHWASDEVLWLDRSAIFMFAVQHKHFSETLITYHPGVMTMWTSGLRTFLKDTGLDVPNLTRDRWIIHLIRARWFIGIFVWAGIGIACLLLYQLFGRWVALASFACLAYSPIFLAQT